MRATLVWLMEGRRMRFDLGRQLQEAEVQDFTLLVAGLGPLVEEEAALYWLATRLHALLQAALRSAVDTNTTISTTITMDTEVFHKYPQIINQLYGL